VEAGGERRIADLSGINPGDDVSVGNSLNADGRRVAEYVRTNVLIGFMSVVGVGQGLVSGTPVDRALKPIAGASRIDFVVKQPFMEMPSPAPGAGEYWHYFATSSAPDEPRTVWVHVLTQVSAN
jgi:hypothetical protein